MRTRRTDQDKAVKDIERGNAKGGLRSPYVDVPVKTYKPVGTPCPSCEPKASCARCSAWCPILMSSIVPFDEAQLKTLYSSHDDYVAKFDASADKMFKDGFVTKIDLEAMKTEAADSDVLR